LALLACTGYAQIVTPNPGSQSLQGFDAAYRHGTIYLLNSNFTYQASLVSSPTTTPMLLDGKGTNYDPNFFLARSMGLSASSFVADADFLYGLTMVSPRHYLCAHHTCFTAFFSGLTNNGIITNGHGALFVATNGASYWRTNVQHMPAVPYADIEVGILNEDLPSSVGFLPLFPANYTNKIPPIPFTATPDAKSIIECFWYNRFCHAPAASLAFYNYGSIMFNGAVPVPFGITDTNLTVCELCAGLWSGDSSKPIRTLVGNQIVLLSHAMQQVFAGTNWVNHAGTGPNYALYIPSINATMHRLSASNGCPDYQLTTVTLP
jgi:hypothetical protein